MWYTLYFNNKIVVCSEYVFDGKQDISIKLAYVKLCHQNVTYKRH